MTIKIDENVKMRLAEVLRESGLTSHAYAQSVQIDPSAFAKKLSGKVSITTSDLEKLEKFGGVSKEWLLTGNGSAKAETSIPPSVVPVYDIDATCGLSDTRTFADITVEGYVDIPLVSKGTVIIRAHGDSMNPTIQDNDYIAIRRLETWDYIMFGHIYIIELPDYRAVKRIRRGTDDGHVILRSDNDNYDDVEIPKADIRSLWIVENVISIKKLF